MQILFLSDNIPKYAEKKQKKRFYEYYYLFRKPQPTETVSDHIESMPTGLLFGFGLSVGVFYEMSFHFGYTRLEWYDLRYYKFQDFTVNHPKLD